MYQFIKVMSGDQLMAIIDTEDTEHNGYAMRLAEAVMTIVDGGGIATVSQMTEAELADFR